MKELVLKKKGELEDICRKTHLIPESNNPIDIAIDAVESGNLYVLKISLVSSFNSPFSFSVFFFSFDKRNC